MLSFFLFAISQIKPIVYIFLRKNIVNKMKN